MQNYEIVYKLAYINDFLRWAIHLIKLVHFQNGSWHEYHAAKPSKLVSALVSLIEMVPDPITVVPSL